MATMPSEPAGRLSPAARVEMIHAAAAMLTTRAARDAAFPPRLFDEPAWEMMLCVFACASEGKAIEENQLVARFGRPHATAKRWMAVLEHAGQIVRYADDGVRMIELTDESDRAMQRVLRAA